MSRKLKIKLYMTVIRPVLLYGAECWTVREKEGQFLEKTEMRMLRRIKGVTLRDKVKSVDIRKELGVNSIQDKVREMRLRWYGHMQRMEESNEERAVIDLRVPGNRPRGRPRGRWMKGYAGTADHPGGSSGQNILELKNWEKAEKKKRIEAIGAVIRKRMLRWFGDLAEPCVCRLDIDE